LKREKRKILEEIEEIKGHILKIERRLSNEDFINKAKKEVIIENEKKLMEFKEKMERLKLYLEHL
jgi:valyl-tRNA synthetase